jgi:hypothetical protein
MSPRVRDMSWRRLAPLGVGALLLVPAAPGATAEGPDLPDALGEWTQPSSTATRATPSTRA